MKDINVYNDRMRKSMMDKLFFVDKVEATVFVDFGCADGSMIKMLMGMFPEYHYVGYDNKPEMVELAKINEPSADFFSNWNELLDYINRNFPDQKKCLVLSSVLHEVEYKREFFDFLNFPSFDFVAIRDMFFCEPKASLPSSLIDKLPEIITAHYRGQLRVNAATLIQAVFKSYYPENIESELIEDYFSFNSDEKWFLESHHIHGLVPVYEYHYLLNYWREKIKTDFGYDLAQSGIKTHIQLIYEVPKTKLTSTQF